jgi:type VI secretion system protein ImpA
LSDLETLMQQAEAWLEPLEGDDGPCGPDLEYDNAFLELSTAAEGKAETQFERGVPPDWRVVRQQAEDLLGRTRDLRVAMLWLRAVVNLEGATALLPGLRLLSGLLQAHWDALHPRPEEGDEEAFERANVLAALPRMEGVLGDLLNARLTQVKGVGDLRLRDVEVSFGHLQPREGETAYSREQLQRMLAGAGQADADLWPTLEACQQALQQLAAQMDERFGTGSGAELKPLRDLQTHALSLRPDLPTEEAAGEEAADGGASAASRASAGSLSGSVNSRADAVRAIELVCAYLERHEPTNPAQLFLRRASSLLERNFLELLKELAPNALDDVARIVGVDPNSVGGGSSAESE